MLWSDLNYWSYTFLNNYILCILFTYSKQFYILSSVWNSVCEAVGTIYCLIWRNFLYWFSTCVLPVFLIMLYILLCFRITENVMENILAENY